MSEFIAKEITKKDIGRVVELYNSNPNFLEHHLGVSNITAEFIQNEIKEMNQLGFSSVVVIEKETEKIVALCDYKKEKEVYLSLLLLDGERKGKGFGKKIYSYFETEWKKSNVWQIRIDVVNDYEGNVTGFWEKVGFEPQENVILEWNNKQSNAVVMRKDL